MNEVFQQLFIIYLFINILVITIYFTAIAIKARRLTDNISIAHKRIYDNIALRNKKLLKAHQEVAKFIELENNILDNHMTTDATKILEVAQAEIIIRDRVRKANTSLINVFIDSEDNIQGARLLYNRSVAQYNQLLQSPLSGLVMKFFGYMTVDYFTISNIE